MEINYFFEKIKKKIVKSNFLKKIPYNWILLIILISFTLPFFFRNLSNFFQKQAIIDNVNHNLAIYNEIIKKHSTLVKELNLEKQTAKEVNTKEYIDNLNKKISEFENLISLNKNTQNGLLVGPNKDTSAFKLNIEKVLDSQNSFSINYILSLRIITCYHKVNLDLSNSTSKISKEWEEINFDTNNESLNNLFISTKNDIVSILSKLDDYEICFKEEKNKYLNSDYSEEIKIEKSYYTNLDISLTKAQNSLNQKNKINFESSIKQIEDTINSKSNYQKYLKNALDAYITNLLKPQNTNYEYYQKNLENILQNLKLKYNLK